MQKDTYYFSHDYNARNDKKISALVREFKSAGYGVFWATAEMLHEEGGEIELDDLTISAISKDLNEDFDLVKNIIDKCILNFKLFCLSPDNILTANRVRRNLDKRKEISKVRSNAGKAGANAKQMQANAEQNVAKERKEKKEIKEIIKNGEQKIVRARISQNEEVEILIFDKCDDWQYDAMVSFLTKNIARFESTRMGKPVLKPSQDFKIILQEFINKIQSTGEYQEYEPLSKHFGNWLGSKNGTLGDFIQKARKNQPQTGVKQVNI